MKDDLATLCPFYQEVIAAEGGFPVYKTHFSQTKVTGLNTWTLLYRFLNAVDFFPALASVGE